ITATAQATNEFESISTCDPEIVGSTCTNPPTAAQLSAIPGSKGLRVTFTAANQLANGSSIFMYNPNGTLVNPTVYQLVAASTNPRITATGTLTYDFECQTGNCFGSGTYYVSFQQPGQCNSSLTPFCLNTTGTTATPAVTTTPLTNTVTIISGTAPANANVTVYINGFLTQFVTASAGGAWTSSVLTLDPCDTINVRAAVGTLCISPFSPTYFVTGGVTSAPVIQGNYCVSGNVTKVTGISSEANGTVIQILVNGSPIATGTTTVNNGYWADSTGISIAPGSTITATALSPCKTISPASNSIVVTSTSSNASLTLTTSPVFEQATTLTGTGINGTQVQVYIDNYPVGSPVTVSGGVWTLTGIQPYEIYPNGVLSLTATSAGGCPSQAVTASTVLCVQPTTTLSVDPANADFCTSTGTVTVTVNNSQSGVIYQLTLANGTTNTGSSILGTGGNITLTSGTLSANTTLQVRALKLPPTCLVLQTDNVPVNFYTAPTLSLAVGAVNSTICSGTSGTVTVANSQTGFTYQLRDNSNNSNIGTPVTGTGSTINLPTGNLTSTTTFNVLATAVSPSTCSGQLTNTVTINVTAAPAAPTGTATQTFCSSSNPTIASLTATGTSIQWYSASTGGSPLASTTTITNGTIYYATQTVSGCESTTRLPVTVTVTTAPSASISYAGSPFCTSLATAQSVTLTGTNGGTFSAGAGLTINASTGAITPSTSTAGTYTVTYSIAA
ncbi:MAG: beta strand repeat-containing protein, partial [Bacteroidota bacterium]